MFSSVMLLNSSFRINGKTYVGPAFVFRTGAIQKVATKEIVNSYNHDLTFCNLLAT